MTGTLNYQLVATDEEGDKILFALLDSTLLFGNASLTSSGLWVQLLFKSQKNNDRGKLYPLLYYYLVFSHLFDLVCFQPDLHSMQRLCRSGVSQHHNVREPDRPRNPPGQLHRRHHYQHSVHQWSTHPIRCIQWKTAAQGRYHRANSGGYSIHTVLFGHNKSIVLNSKLYIKHGFIYPANEIKQVVYTLFQILQIRKISFAII